MDALKHLELALFAMFKVEYSLIFSTYDLLNLVAKDLNLAVSAV